MALESQALMPSSKIGFPILQKFEIMYPKSSSSKLNEIQSLSLTVDEISRLEHEVEHACASEKGELKRPCIYHFTTQRHGA